MTKAVAVLARIGLIFFGLISLYALFVGLTFGGALWDFENLDPTWRWLGVICAPFPILVAHQWWRHSSPLLLLSVFAACALLAPYLMALSS